MNQLLPPTRSRFTDDGWLSPYFPAVEARRDRAVAAVQDLTGGASLWEWSQGHKWFGLHRKPDDTK